MPTYSFIKGVVASKKFQITLGFCQIKMSRVLNRPFCYSILWIWIGEKIFLQLNLILILLGKFLKSFHKLFWLHLDETRLYIFFTATMYGINIKLTPTTPSSLIEPSSNFSFSYFWGLVFRETYFIRFDTQEVAKWR